MEQLPNSSPNLIQHTRLRDEDITDRMLLQFMQKSYFLKQKHRRISWNWPAFFFGSMWFLYRKMYFNALVLVVISYGFPMMMQYFFSVKIHNGVMLLVGSTICALIANRVYLAFSREEIRVIYYEYTDEQERKEQMEGNGGTHWVVLIPAGLAILIINLFFSGSGS